MWGLSGCNPLKDGLGSRKVCHVASNEPTSVSLTKYNDTRWLKIKNKTSLHKSIVEKKYSFHGNNNLYMYIMFKKEQPPLLP